MKKERIIKRKAAVKKILSALEDGFSLRSACGLVGLHLSTLAYWMRLDDTLQLTVRGLIELNRIKKKSKHDREKAAKAEGYTRPRKAVEVIPIYGKRYTCWRCGWDFTCRTYGKPMKCPACQTKFWYLEGKHPDQSTATVRAQYRRSPRMVKRDADKKAQNKNAPADL